MQCLVFTNSSKMATVELEPLFIKGLKLMHSSRANALEDLKQMTDEAIALRRGELALKKLVLTDEWLVVFVGDNKGI